MNHSNPQTTAVEDGNWQQLRNTLMLLDERLNRIEDYLFKIDEELLSLSNRVTALETSRK